MAEQKFGLGRGLSALLGDGASPPSDGAAGDGRRLVAIELIRRNPDQPRRSFAEAEIEELAASIREKGVLQPILVRPMRQAPGEYQIVAGERRWRAAQRAGLADIPVVVRELDDAEALELAILENVQRADLNAVEEARGYKALMDAFGRTQEQLAQAVSKSRSHVANTLRLLNLPNEVQELVLGGFLSAGHARALVTAEDPVSLARRIVEQGLSVRDAEALARGERPVPEGEPEAPSGAAPRRSKDIDTLALEKSLADALGLTVDIRDKAGKGEIRVKYRTLEQLEDVCRRLGRP